MVALLLVMFVLVVTWVVTLLFVMFVLVVTWLVAVPVHHLGDLVHTIKVSHHVCAWFFGMSIALDGSSGGQTGTGRISSLSL